MSQTVIIDYGAGNIHSVLNSFRAVALLGEEISLCADPHMLANADRIILPGVGAYAACHEGLAAINGMIEALEEAAIKRAKPFLGICVGMQLLVQSGKEHGVLTSGLGWLSGDVRRIAPTDPSAKIPHMGWNDLHFDQPHPVFEGIKNGTDVYFVHSYSVQNQDENELIATTDYHGSIAAAIGRDNIIGTQFHPEKSQKNGLQIIRNFLDWKP